MGDLKKCDLRGYHKLIFEEDSSLNSILSSVGLLVCSECGASSDGISVDLSIKGELISQILYGKLQDDLRAIDDDRISHGLK